MSGARQPRVIALWSLICLSLLFVWIDMSACSNSCNVGPDCPPGLLCLPTADGLAKECRKASGTEPGEDKPVTPDAAPDDNQPDDRTPPPDTNKPKDEILPDTPKETLPEVIPEPRGKAPAAGDLVINEVHADPKSGTGDANGDGTASSTDDEFIEFVNTTDQEIALGGVTLTADKDIITFAPGTVLPPKTAVVVFRGGLDADPDVNTGKPHTSKFGGALVYTKTMSLANGGRKIVLKDKDGGELSAFGYGSEGTDCPGDKDQSVTLSPDLTGSCKLHTEASPSQALFSPGTRADGSKFSDPLPEPPPVEKPSEVVADVVADGGTEPPPERAMPPEPQPDVPTGAIPGAGELVINELLADPSTDAVKGDANGDGVRSSTADEFVEIVNVSNKTLQLQGVKLLKTTSSTSTIFTFQNALLLPPKGVVVIFGGGTDANFNTGKPHPTKFGNAIVYTSSLVLTNGGATISLENAAGVELSKLVYSSSAPCKGDNDNSVTLDPDLTGTCKEHQSTTGAKLYSPGTKSDGTKF